ncbi:MAG: hypothetical protein JWR90_2211 [Marmoricola sp.]|jgi:hypothetical protein|nr:hypothetical protein [Marmoricola sp.]
MSDSETGHRDQASSSIDPGSEDVKHSRKVARAQARWVRQAAAAVGVGFLVVGVLGFVPGVTTHYDQLSLAGHGSGAELLGLFQVSILHNLVHLAFGIAGLALSRTMRSATYYLVGGGVVYLVLWFYGLVIGHHSAGNFVPVNDADNWLHLGLGVGMVLLGFIGRRAMIAPGEPVSP